MSKPLIRVETPSVVAGIILRDDKVIVVAPALKQHFLIGMTREQVIQKVKSKGWKYQELESSDPDA